jgi:hypothetical protein
MKPLRFLLVLFSIILLSFILNPSLFGWGFFAHSRINKMAVFSLPPSMIGFYKKHIDYLSDHATDPDRRRYADKDEAPRHYIDLDHYGDHPFDSIPQRWDEAVVKFSEDSLKTYGIVPWHIDRTLFRLTEAFRHENMDMILHYSADLGHYIGDAHVPLHTTENYNGQLTNQRGIHGFWESRIPELKADEYDYFVGGARYIEKPLKVAWDAVKESYSYKDSVLIIEARLNKRFPSDRKYAFENRAGKTVKTYSEEYTIEYDKMLNGMVENRMRKSIKTVADFWYTAWVNAGHPDLSRFDNKEISDSLRLANKKEAELWKKDEGKKVKGHDD